jgi:hypothetical protein
MTRNLRASGLSLAVLALLSSTAWAGQLTPINLTEPAAGKTALPPISSDLVEKVVATNQARKPVLTFSEESLPPEIAAEVYSRPMRAPDVSPQKIMTELNDVPSQTVVGRKISELSGDLDNLKRNVTDLSARAQSLQKNTQAGAASYYAAVATISTQLQSGTTPGNPRLVQRLASAQDALENLADRIGAMSDLSMEIANQSSFASYLLESARAAYGLTGAMEEDHNRLAQLEDSINNTVVVLERLQNNTSDDVTRTSAYLATERSNLRTLGLAIENGDLYGKALAARPFSSVPVFQGPSAQQAASMSPAVGGPASVSGNGFAPAPRLQGPRPLAKIRFDRDNVDYQEPVYLAVHEALEKYPDATFDLVAVHPEKGNPAQVAIESSRARRNAEKVLRTLTEMGLPVERINLSYAPSASASSNEVHLYIR